MDRFTKINEINNLQDAIKKQKQIIEMEKERLRALENEYSKSNVVELPVLLFIIKENDKNNYVYYCVDFNEPKFISKENEILNNAIDLRNVFKKLNMPLEMNNENSIECSEKIEYAFSLLISKLDELFSQYDIKSWQELGIYLQSLREEDFNFEQTRNNEGIQPKN